MHHAVARNFPNGCGQTFPATAGVGPFGWRDPSLELRVGVAWSLLHARGSSRGNGMSRIEQEDNKQALPLIALPAMSVGDGFDLLAGVRVLDLTGSIAGPYATMLLADMGADIIKVERPGLGDDTRSWGPPFLEGEALWFLSVNRNKRSISLDYTIPEGLAILKKLVAICDVVVVNHLPKVASKLGVGVASLQALKSDLIYVSITGFGLEGERSDWACYDL